MRKPKQLATPTAIRVASIATLRSKLGELQAMSDAGDRREEVYATFVAVGNEIERRKSRPNAKPSSLISKGASKLLKIGDIRAMYERLLGAINPSTEQANTRDILAEEMERRSALAKRTYQKRRARALTFMTFMHEQHGVEP